METTRTDAAQRGAALPLRPQHNTSIVPGLSAATVLLTTLLAVGLSLRLYRLDAQSLWLDEGSTWAETTGRTGKGWATLLAELWSPDAAYPLYHVLLRASIGVLGDSEWALRLPSALVGTLALLFVYLAACELAMGQGATPHAVASLPIVCLVAPALVLLSPFALWYAQEVKTYSLLLLALSAALWLLLRALRLGTQRAWLLYLVVAGAAFFVHRLALLALVAGAVAYLLTTPPRDWRVRWLGWLLIVAGAAVATLGTMAAVGSESTRSGGHIAAGPLTGLWLTLGRLSLDRGLGSFSGFVGLPSLAVPVFPTPLGWLGADLAALLGGAGAPELPRLWLLPTLLLWGWGLWKLIRAARSGDQAALAVLLAGAVPVALFAVAQLATQLYEPRYMMIVFPAWALTLAYPLLAMRREAKGQGRELQLGLGLALVGLVLTTQAAALLQPEKGLWSGDPVKEQWREAIAALARRTQPDDLVILHPHYAQPLWDYYAPRVTADAMPPPVTFPFFGEGYRWASLSSDQAREFARKYYEQSFAQRAGGKARALLLIAPEHARTVDPPLTQAELQNKARRERWDSVPEQDDEYGVLGLRFQYPQRTWPCGGDEFVGVHLMCQSFPELFGTGKPPEPAIRPEATFGDQLVLRGYTLKPFRADSTFAPGGTLPVTLYWAAARQPDADYTMFLHLCRDCELPPVASDDAPPLLGYPPAGRTSTWIVGDPVHDERALSLPRDLPPGRYRLLLGVYPLGQPAPEARLSVDGEQVLGNGRLLLGEVEVR
jgi:mannosyltransferase